MTQTVAKSTFVIRRADRVWVRTPMSNIGNVPGRLPDGEFNPYAPPRAPVGPQQLTSRTMSPSGLAHRDAIVVPHELTDADLRRFVNCDAFYDPLPLWRFIPQWAWYLAIVAPIMYFFSVRIFHSPGLSALCAAGFSFLSLFYMSLLAKSRRTVARLSGLCEKRQLSIDPDGLAISMPNTLAVSADLQTVGPMNCAWSDIRKIETREGYLYFWLKGRRRVVLPLSAFSTDAEARTFIDAADRWYAAVR